MAINTDRPVDLDVALRELPQDMKITLALLHPASDEIAELTLATLPLGSRVMLAGFRIIDTARTEKTDDPVIVSLTDFGREVISHCALEGLPTEVSERLNALAEARARRAAGQPGPESALKLDASRADGPREKAEARS